MGNAAAPIPADCSASCILDCDVWAGQIECQGVQWEVYGGLASMAAMQLSQPGASVEGHQDLAAGADLSWGVGPGPDRRFCTVVQRGAWNWEICSPDSPGQRVAILTMARGYTLSFPRERVLACKNDGC